jgi:hypothetical protein
VIARSTFKGYPQVTYGFVGYDSVGTDHENNRREMTTMAITDVDVFAHLTDADI